MFGKKPNFQLVMAVMSMVLILEIKKLVNENEFLLGCFGNYSKREEKI